MDFWQHQMCNQNSMCLLLTADPSHLTMVLTIQGLCPREGTASSIRGWVLTKLSISSGKEFEELKREP